MKAANMAASMAWMLVGQWVVEKDEWTADCWADSWVPRMAA